MATRTLALLLTFVAIFVSPAQAEPKMRVENIRRAFYNVEHNAFTDLIRWRDRFWLTFRSCPDGHQVAASASVIVLSSKDARTWREERRFSVPQRDTRDPHFLSPIAARCCSTPIEHSSWRWASQPRKPTASVGEFANHNGAKVYKRVG